MPRTIIKIKDRYFEWSSIVDAPVTYGMTEEELRQYIEKEYGRRGTEALPERLQRVEEVGTSELGASDIDYTIGCNRAGPQETRFTAEEIYRKFGTPTTEPFPGRKFYKTIFQFEVLSEEPIDDPVTLEQIHYETQEGRWSGRFLDTAQKVLTGKQAAKALIAQGSDPEFLRLTEDGKDVEE